MQEDVKTGCIIEGIDRSSTPTSVLFDARRFEKSGTKVIALRKIHIRPSMRGNVLPVFLLAVASGVLAGCSAAVSANLVPPKTAVNIIYDDDCDIDIDCAITQPVIHHWIDSGWIKMLGMVSSAPSRLGAPSMKVFQAYYAHNGFSIGAQTPNCTTLASTSWNEALVGRFDSGDVCGNYATCAIVLRQMVANYIADSGELNGISYVITGPLTCEEAFRASPADATSDLTGIQMEQRYIKQFVLMNGAAPSGLEYNCARDSSACSAFFAGTTVQNGYPPVYVIPVNTGALNVATKISPNSLTLSDPTTYTFSAAGATEAQDEDVLAMEYAVFGSSGWRSSSSGTNVVDAVAGSNLWNMGIASGQYYLTTTAPAEEFEQLFAGSLSN